MRQRQEHHFYSVFFSYPYPGEPELAWFGFSAKGASWAFYKAIVAASGKPGVRGIDLRQDGQNVASVTVKTVSAIA